MDASEELRRSRISKARVILTHRGFLEKPEAQKRAVIASLLAMGLSASDLALLERELSGVAPMIPRQQLTAFTPQKSEIHTLVGDPLFEVIRKLDWKSIDRLCRTDRTFARFCENKREAIWNFLFLRDIRPGGMPLDRKMIPRGVKSVSGEYAAKEFYLKYYKGHYVYVAGSIGFQTPEQDDNGRIHVRPGEAWEGEWIDDNIVINTAKYLGSNTRHRGRWENTNNIVDISAGYDYVAMVDFHGRLFTVGPNGNNYDDVDVGWSIEYYLPTEITSAPKLLQVSCGAYYIGMLDLTGQFYTIGYDDLRSWAHPFFRISENGTPPQKIEGYDNITKIACGRKFTLLLVADGTVVILEHDLKGTGMIADAKKTIFNAVQIVDISTKAVQLAMLDVNGKVWAMGDINHSKIAGNIRGMLQPIISEYFADHTVKKISCGRYYTAAINTAGVLLVYGKVNVNDPVKLSTHSAPTGVVEVASGDECIIAVHGDGTYAAMGDNKYKQLGLHIKTSPVRSFTVSHDRTVNKVEKIIKVACGSKTTLFLTDKAAV